MFFEPAEELTPERKELYNKILKTYFDDWGSSVRYYGFCSTDKTWDYTRHDKIAKSHFSSVEKTIRTNQNVLKARGFEGKITFKIQNAEKGTTVDSFELTF